VILQKSDKILDICARNGLEVQFISSRFRFHECPFCGDIKWKVWLYENTHDDSVAGKCFKCDKKFSLYQLLEKIGLPQTELNEICSKRKTDADNDFDFTLTPLLDVAEAKIGILHGEWQRMPSWRYWDIEDKQYHPASLYATSRGIQPALYPEIKIDIQNNAVVFLVRDEHRNVVGFQSRYVEPKTDNKTYTAFGFKTGDSLLRYFNKTGDIFICEGPFNAVVAHNWGHTGLCTFGSKISDYQLKEIRNIAEKLNKRICCAFDEDDAGYHAYLQVKDVLAGYGREVLRVRPEFGNDLNDSWKNGTKYEVIEDKVLSLYHFLPELKL
jgi:hypothetical protein